MRAAKRDLFKAAEVCEVANVQPYVLRSWEAEFPQLGRTPADGGSRVYGRSDIEMVLRIKDLVFGEGLTLAGARRRLDEGDEASARPSMSVDEVLGERARQRVRFVRDGLRGLLQMLDGGARGGSELVLAAPEPGRRNGKARRRASR